MAWKRALYLGLALVLLNAGGELSAQSDIAVATRTAKLQALADKLRQRTEENKRQARHAADQMGIPLRRELPNGKVLELQRVVPGLGPQFYITYNVDAADTVSTDEVWPGGSAGLALEGNGMTMGEWDGGAVEGNHPDLHPRVTQVDNASVISDHATHVAGTLVGAGVALLPDARGMAPAALLHAYDWNFDTAEMADAAAAGLLVSNHSYGIAAGWVQVGVGEWWWIGGPGSEDPNFGLYDAETQLWDTVAFEAPDYLIVKAAGNDRWDIGPDPGTFYTVVDQDGNALGTSNENRPADCAPDGYDCLPTVSVAKNILTVGAVDDVPGGYQALTGPAAVQMTAFSGWGPTDDGRIKPDVVGNGWLLMSTYAHDPYYAAAIGTSMASPNVAGSLLLLQEHYQDVHGAGSKMRGATLKALAIHTADETGDANGPDYEFGWGLLNTRTAATVISEDGAGTHRIVEGTLANGATDTVVIDVNQADAIVTATLVWMDPPGTPPAPSLDPTDSMLVNDLDLRITDGVSTWLPWVLDPAAPAAAATTGDNVRDNVEQVEVYGAGIGAYTVEINHKGTLLDGEPQHYSLIISISPPPPVSTGLVIDEDFSGGLPPGWSVETLRGTSWSFRSPGTGKYANNTPGSGNYAMVDNYVNDRYSDTLTSLRTQTLDLSTVSAAVLSFDSYFHYDQFETINVDASTNGGAGWINVWQHQGFSNIPVHYTLDLTGTIAGHNAVMLRFRFQSGFLGPDGYEWQIDNVQLETFGGAPPPEPPPDLNLPGQADNPEPPNGSLDVAPDTSLAWTPGSLATSHTLYLGTDSTLGAGDVLGSQAGSSYGPLALEPDTLYYWRVDEVNADGTTPGITWSFTTGAAPEGDPPGPATSPTPGDGALGVGIDTTLAWTGDPAATSHDVYFGTSSSFGAPVNQSSTSFDPGTLLHDTEYFWRIDEVNSFGTTTGPTWRFSTEAAPVVTVMHVGDLDATRIEQPRNRWQAEVMVAVHDSTESPLSGVTVSGSWSAGTSGSGTCVTGSGGQCTLSKNNLKGSVSSVNFSVTSLSHPDGHLYDAASNHDPDYESSGTAVTVPSDTGPAPGNTPPAVAVTAPSDGAGFNVGELVTFAGSATDDEDGTLSSSLQWRSSLDGDISTGSNITTSSLSEGSHTITASVTDSGGASGEASIGITIGTVPQGIDAHVGLVTGSSSSSPRNRWAASVTIHVHDSGHGPLAAATVSGSWSDGVNGSSSCETDASGSCTLTKGSIKSSVSSVRFSVDSISGSGMTYQPASNEQASTIVNAP